ncbi:hypothetical protein XYCOK13_29210 [Xylanibacillus composti]|uniref:Uncharacterized protein n=1 Tax=Xylanibacillus composti TaxID=1572762 RepID=A0A8J4H336_9BACL|nr:hypothetical protein XYCOK13_29210 [Xylanibacillus composti]
MLEGPSDLAVRMDDSKRKKKAEQGFSFLLNLFFQLSNEDVELRTISFVATLAST